MRQGFHQFMMHMYQSYLQSNSEQKAKEIVAECIKEQLNLLIGDDFLSSSECAKLKERKEALDKELAASDNYDMQLYLAEKIDTLQGAIDIMTESY
jgi:hypothetical protein